MVSVIIPAYNVEQYIFECVDSVLTQTYQNFEIIIVNDGSADNTYHCMQTLAAMDSRIKIFDSENRGQGYQRNKMLEYAQGDYILFLDSDDYLEPHTLEVCVKRITEDQSDLVYFDWKYYSEKAGRFNYKNKEMFFGRKTLEGNDCLLLLSISPYFSVNRLYDKAFLKDNQIRYGEGHLYEDNPFIVATAFYAKKISIIHSPLYVVRVSETSSTKSGTNTDVHYYGFLKSVELCKEILQQKPDEKHYYYYRYALERYFLYIRSRIPAQMQKQFTKEFLELLGDVDIKPIYPGDRIMNLFLRHKVFKKKKVLLPNLINFYYTKVRSKRKKVRLFVKKHKTAMVTGLKNGMRKLRHKPIPPNQSKEYREFLTHPLEENTVLFLGFDFRYTGNSRYLYELMMQNPGDKTIYFATKDPSVDTDHRLEPYSIAFYEVLATAQVLIFESWTPPTFRKRLNATWIQLWHGTPLKKMLFDSEETEIITQRDVHKINKYIDIQKWDYLVTDSVNINPYFETSFLTPKKQLLPCGYPRVKYLADNQNNEALKKKIKEKYGIDPQKEIVVYLPTWRDYNYGKTTNVDNDYLLDTPKFQEQLGDHYLVIDKNHSYLNTAPTAHQDMETQELLLIADFLVTDYSSVMYDAFAMDIPVAIYCNDFEKYQNSRGVYPELWEDLKPYVSETIDGLCQMIRGYTFGEAYQLVKERYCFKDNVAWLLNIIDNALNSHSSQKRVLYSAKVDVEKGISAQTLASIRRAAEYADQLYVVLWEINGNAVGLYSYKFELEAMNTVHRVLIQQDEDLSELLQRNHINAIVMEDTPENRAVYQNKYRQYEGIFII